MSEVYLSGLDAMYSMMKEPSKEQLIEEIKRLRDELAALKGEQVAVAEVVRREPYLDGTINPNRALKWSGDNEVDDLPVGTKLYTHPAPQQPGQGT